MTEAADAAEATAAPTVPHRLSPAVASASASTDAPPCPGQSGVGGRMAADPPPPPVASGPTAAVGTVEQQRERPVPLAGHRRAALDFFFVISFFPKSSHSPGNGQPNASSSGQPGRLWQGRLAHPSLLVTLWPPRPGTRLAELKHGSNWRFSAPWSEGLWLVTEAAAFG